MTLKHFNELVKGKGEITLWLYEKSEKKNAKLTLEINSQMFNQGWRKSSKNYKKNIIRL